MDIDNKIGGLSRCLKETEKALDEYYERLLSLKEFIEYEAREELNVLLKDYSGREQ